MFPEEVPRASLPAGVPDDAGLAACPAVSEGDGAREVEAVGVFEGLAAEELALLSR